MTTAVVPVRNKPIRSAEREFLPAALEIMETPPSQIGRLAHISHED
jgi:hemolysin D